ncbi:DUF87 domain-containing protein [Paenibacillus sp. GD4]|uniref:ATP-binding protein n=1 Tax=Paenibacillus sp. GD4 TaxID=3068890 RepID=UPI0027966D9D|nr:DUF87 domain-containing protein [Paenibacillus sp. GD4]MDQ1908948.1 DUF87 domain-containing protein [Paenibacillus sp. GD4]
MEQISEWKRLKAHLQESRFSHPSVPMESYRFYRIHRITVTDELSKEQLQSFVHERIQQFIASCSDKQSPLVLRIRSDRSNRTISIFIGEKIRSGSSIADRFSAFFQSVQYEEAALRPAHEEFAEQLLVTGIPVKNESARFQYIEPFLRMIQGKDAMLEIVARPVHRAAVFQQLQHITELRTTNSKRLSLSRSESRAESETYSSSHGETMTDASNSGGNLILVNSGSTLSEGTTSTSSDSRGMTETITTNIQYAEHEAVQFDRLLETHAERMNAALSSGLWKTSISLYAHDSADLTAMAEVYRSPYSPGAVEPYQLLKLSRSYETISWQDKASIQHGFRLSSEDFREFSFLTGEELAYAWDLPKEEIHGYELTQSPRFGQNPPPRSGIVLGRVYDGDKLTATTFSMDREQLVRHMLVAGITGSGKTNTVFTILQSVNVPFLIIEPAKKEYRMLKASFPDLRVYTLGNESVSPLRINPFYFPPSVHIQQHIDNLKVIFNASFTMYASMPNILEQCITNVYMKKGWSLSASRNIYQSDPQLYHKYFPTVEDLYHEIDSYTRELGYAQEQMQNIRAALLTRIKSLMTGGKGWMLNTVDTMDIQELLRYPTVLELEAVADDDEKSLVIGLISVFIYEYLKVQQLPFSGELKHLLVFEEAHRIFANVNQQGSQEEVNIKGKAVESLSHILSEIRAYGEGMIIVDQVPTKLAPDVLKNTNTKIIHRIVSKDDAEYVANSLALPMEKTTFISKLTNGSALIYSDGMDTPSHLQMHHGKAHLGYVNDRMINDDYVSNDTLGINKEPIHPLAEIILQNVNTYSELIAAVSRFYRLLIDDSLIHLQRNYGNAKEEVLRLAGEYGFDLNIDVEHFVFTFIQHGLYYTIKKNAKMTKKINKQIFVERYVESCLELVSKDYETYKKEYLLLELNKQKLGGDSDV